MGYDGADERIAQILSAMARCGHVILQERDGTLRFAVWSEAGVVPMQGDLPRPPAVALVKAMFDEGLISVAAEDPRPGALVFALTAEGRRASRLKVQSEPAESGAASNLVDLHNKRTTMQTNVEQILAAMHREGVS